MKNKVSREIRIICASLVLGAILALFFEIAAYAEKTSADISNNFIRFHVLANSDSEEDQALKLIVRDAVLDSIGKRINETETLSEARQLLTTSLKEIENTAKTALLNEGSNYDVKASVERVYFPTKAYGGVTLAAGSYEALRLQIGASVGDNWWCVVYPPLCYVDAAKSEVSYEYEERLKNTLTDEQYKLVSQSDDVSVKIKFKTIELFQEGKMLIASINDIVTGLR